MGKAEGKQLGHERIMGDKNLAQNESKQETIPVFMGEGAHKHARQLFYGELKLQGALSRDARYLGSRIASNGGNGTEITKRIKAAAAAFYSMGGLWHRAGTPMTYKKLALASKVQSTLLAGLEAFVLTKREYARLDGEMARLARIAMAGRASTMIERGTDKI